MGSCPSLYNDTRPIPILTCKWLPGRLCWLMYAVSEEAIFFSVGVGAMGGKQSRTGEAAIPSDSNSNRTKNQDLIRNQDTNIMQSPKTNPNSLATTNLVHSIVPGPLPISTDTMERGMDGKGQQGQQKTNGTQEKQPYHGTQGQYTQGMQSQQGQLVNQTKQGPSLQRREEEENQSEHAEQHTHEFGARLSQKLTVDDFELLSVVGKGSFGKVMCVRKKDTGKIYAMKVLKKAQLVARKQIAHTYTERRVLEEIEHPFIVSLRFAFQTEDKLYMVLDFFQGGELFFHLKHQGKFVEDRVRLYAAEIILALECLHNHGIVYRDLKPENV